MSCHCIYIANVKAGREIKRKNAFVAEIQLFRQFVYIFKQFDL